MHWSVSALAAILFTGISDIFRKLGSSIKDPFLANALFQTGSFLTGMILYLLFSRRTQFESRAGVFAFVGGALICTFTLLSFKALSTGPGVAVVMPVLRIGGIVLTVLLGILFLRERLNAQTLVGLVFSIVGIYLLFSQK